MERVLSVEQMKTADRVTIEKTGVDEQTLIERAGRAVADEIVKRFRGGRVLVCIGKGNNGEDGKVVARELSKIHGFTVATLNVYNGIFKMLDKKFDIIVDCIFGTGLNREVEGKYKTAIEKINDSGAYVVACDIASGLNGDNGKPMGIAIKANLTVAIQEYKLGHFLNDGPDYSGKVVARDIGISVWGDDYSKKLSKCDLKEFFPERKRNVNKGCFGKTAVVGGSKEYTGSALLSANALTALKTGSGYSYLFVAESLLPIYAGKNPEVIVKPVADSDGEILFSEDFCSQLLKFDSVAIGMGMVEGENLYKIIGYLLENFNGNLIIDAGGLNVISKFGTEILGEKKCKVILTPHVGEFARLIQTNKDVIMSDIIDCAKDFAKEFGVILLLKSATSVITDGEQVYINVSGCQGMAKAGSGDVLSGILCGMTGKCDYLLDTVAGASYLFGLCGEVAQENSNVYTVTASDIINALPVVLNSI